MTDTPKWVTALAKTLIGTIFKGYAVRSDYPEIIEAIILKHCPDDKGAGKLVEAVKKAVSAGRGGLTAETVEARRISIIELEAALAVYEGLNK